MKKIYLIPLAIGLGFAAQSCDDFLNTQPSESYSEDLVWGSAANIEYFINGRYSQAMAFYVEGIYNSYTLGSGSWDRNFTNNMANGNAGADGTVQGNITTGSNIAYLDSYFSYIRACNMIIENCQNNDVLTAQQQTEYVAMGKLLRAMVYYDFARKCGKFMWVGEVLDEDSDFEIPLTSGPAESYAYVLKDLRDAVAGLPSTSLAGVPNKNAALVLLSEACLTAAAYTNDAASLQNGMSLYQEAINAVDQISGYSLDPNYGDMFNENGAYSSPELILCRYASAENTQLNGTYMQWTIANIPNSNLRANNCYPLWTRDDIVVFEAWGMMWPTQNLVDAYLVIDETDGLAKPWNETSQWLNNVKEVSVADAYAAYSYKLTDSEETVDGYVVQPGEEFVIGYQTTNSDANISDLMYNNRDARFAQSILYNGSEFYGQTMVTTYHGNFSRYTNTLYTELAPITNYGMRKYAYENVSPRFINTSYTAYHWVIFRYGRALLNKAEAQLRLGDVAGAVETLNQTRTVHGQLPPSTASTLADAWTDYKRERRVELFFETDWYFSLLRWGMYGGDANYGYPSQSVIPELTESASFMEINTECNTAFVANLGNGNDRRVFNAPRAYLFPIPQSLINANPAITNADQNPGW